MDFLILLVVFIGSLFLYFMPSLIAYNHNKTQKLPILLLNIFLGWTLLFWVICLVWACTEEKPTIKNETVAQKMTTTEELEKLAELKEKGIITEDEFNKKKSQILGL